MNSNKQGVSGEFTADFMNPGQVEIIEKNLGIKLSPAQVLTYKKWAEIFINYNSHTNLMSANEIPNLFEKHLYDSLSVALWGGFNKVKNSGKLMDIGTGGGFPSVVLAVAFPEITVIANDSRSKKINFIKEAKEILGLKNLKISLGRAEEIDRENANIITFRAVGKMKDYMIAAKKHAKKGAAVVFYKAKDVKTEIDEALRKDGNLKQPEIVPYSLPVNVETTRNLVIFRI